MGSSSASVKDTDVCEDVETWQNPCITSLLPVIGAHDKQNVSRIYREASRAKNHVETVSKWVPETRRPHTPQWQDCELEA